MIRISLAYLFTLANAIEPLEKLDPTTKYGDVFLQLYEAQGNLNNLLNGAFFSFDLRSCRQTGVDLLNATNHAVEHIQANFNNEMQVDAYNVKFAYQRFKPLFLAELAVVPAYFVSRHGAYDTLTLLDDGASLFPPALRVKVPEAVADANEAGKALAYELGTACGFHIFRIVESVLKRYWDTVSGRQTRPKLETLGNYAAEMEKKNFGDAKIWETLSQLAKLHRNPLIHPDVILTVDEAIEIVGIARSAIGAMLRTLPDVPPTTGLIAS
jgi:hypothetical protein